MKRLIAFALKQRFFVIGGVEALLSSSHGMRIHSNSGFRLWHPPEEDRRLLVVAHEGSISVILSRLLDVEPVSWAFVRFSSYWAAITRLVTVPIADGYAFSLRAFNEIEHLRPLGLPPGGRRG